jgi:hypothetical protein
MHCQMKHSFHQSTNRIGLANAGSILGLLACIALLALLIGCPPPPPEDIAPKGVFLAASNKIYDRGDGFDIKDRIEYPEAKKEGCQDVSTNITDRALAMARCTWCHECGFNEAFDVARYGKPGWSPYYRGEQWQPIVERMSKTENTLLNEVLAERIFNFLRDSTLGKYDESKDSRGGAIRDNPVPQGNPPPASDSAPSTPAPAPPVG